MKNEALRNTISSPDTVVSDLIHVIVALDEYIKTEEFQDSISISGRPNAEENTWATIGGIYECAADQISMRAGAFAERTQTYQIAKMIKALDAKSQAGILAQDTVAGILRLACKNSSNQCGQVPMFDRPFSVADTPLLIYALREAALELMYSLDRMAVLRILDIRCEAKPFTCRYEIIHTLESIASEVATISHITTMVDEKDQEAATVHFPAWSVAFLTCQQSIIRLRDQTHEETAKSILFGDTFFATLATGDGSMKYCLEELGFNISELQKQIASVSTDNTLNIITDWSKLERILLTILNAYYRKLFMSEETLRALDEKLRPQIK